MKTKNQILACCPFCESKRLSQSIGEINLDAWQYSCGTINGSIKDQSVTCKDLLIKILKKRF